MVITRNLCYAVSELVRHAKLVDSAATDTCCLGKLLGESVDPVDIPVNLTFIILLS